jgi:hypothetical protein
MDILIRAEGFQDACHRVESRSTKTLSNLISFEKLESLPADDRLFSRTGERLGDLICKLGDYRATLSAVDRVEGSRFSKRTGSLHIISL